MNDFYWNLLAFMGILGGFSVGFFAGGLYAESLMQQKAIENDSAHWRINSLTGERSFCWGPEAARKPTT